MADKLPLMRWWPSDFYGDPKVIEMTGDQRRVYRELLDFMWMRDGLISADDHIIARMLGMHVRTWRAFYKDAIRPLLTHFSPPMTVTGMYTQKRLMAERKKALDMVAKRSELAAGARNKKQQKQQKGASKSERKSAPDFKPDFKPDDSIETNTGRQSKKRSDDQAIATATEEDEGSALQAENLHQAEPSQVSALPPRAKLPDMPSSPVEPEGLPAPTPLSKRLVSQGIKKPGSLSDLLKQITEGKE